MLGIWLVYSFVTGDAGMADKGDTDGGYGKKKSPRKSSSLGEKYDAEFRGYINVDLSGEEKELWAAWAKTQSPWDALEAFVADGINISLKLDAKTEGAFIASATQRRVGSPNAGLCVTARGREATIALSRVLFVVTKLNHGERWESVQPMANPDRW